MIKKTLTALLFLITAAPVQASVYAVQQKDGSWEVRKYDDGDPKISITYRDLNKTIKVDGLVEERDPSRRFTASGKAKRAEYERADQAWMDAKSGPNKTLPNSVTWCGSGGCFYPNPGEEGRPQLPELKEGVDYTYGTRTVTGKIDKPNPSYGQLEEPVIFFSDKAKKPGGAWLMANRHHGSNV